jgi:hypothetical protein
MQTAAQNTAPRSYIGRPGECDAEFYGRWLIVAGQAERYWRELLSEPKFNRQVERLTCAYLPDFGIAATTLLSQIVSNPPPLAVNLWGDSGEEFAMMVKMGLFRGQRGQYQLNLPKALNVKKVKSAALMLLRTQDRHLDLHPERIVVTAPIRKAPSSGGQVGTSFPPLLF